MGSDEKWAWDDAAKEETKLTPGALSPEAERRAERKIERSMEQYQRTPVHEAPGVKEALAFVAREYALDAGQIRSITITGSALDDRPLIKLELYADMTQQPEQLRERASALLTVANEREGLSSDVLHDVTAAGERTLEKVHAGLRGLALSEQAATDIIAAIQNEGILFREREEH